MDFSVDFAQFISVQLNMHTTINWIIIAPRIANSILNFAECSYIVAYGINAWEEELITLIGSYARLH